MSGNYDVTNVTARNGVDNSSSFRTGRNGKKVFIGTDWNETSHITNDANSGTVFQDGQGMTLKLNSRYKNGGADVFSNLDRRHTGISFDLLDKFIEAAANGVLEDVDHQGYTRENMVAFGRAFDQLRSQKLAEAQRDPYSKKYTKMMNGTEFTFTAQELEQLYKAAGFDLVKKNPPAQEVPEVTTPTMDPIPATPQEQPINEVPETQTSTAPQKPVQQPVEQPEGNERISHNGQAIVNEIARVLGLPDGEVEITFDGDAVCYENDVLIYAEGTYTYNGETKKFRIDRSGETERVQTKKPGILRKWHDVEVPQGPTPRAQARRGQVGSFEATTTAVTDTAIADQNAPQSVDPNKARLDNYYQQHVTDARYWNGRINVDEDTQDATQFHGSYDQVESKDGRRLARVTTYNSETHQREVKYYEVKAADIHSKYGQNRVYPQIIPDLTREVTDAEF